MKKHLLSLAILIFGLTQAYSQFGPQAAAPRFGGAMTKIFGDNQTFSADVKLEMSNPQTGTPVMMPAKMAFDSGKSRMEINMAEMQGSGMSPQVTAQMKSMGMDRMVTIGRPDKKVAYLVYPGLQSYAQMALQDAETAMATNDVKIDTMKLGTETVDGHSCVKNKVVITDKSGTHEEATVWNAPDLKNFPIKIKQSQQGQDVTMTFKNISMTKPGAGLFEPESAYTKYDDVQTMIQQVIMKRMSSGLPAH